MGANKIPERPSKVTLALYMLYLSLGIAVMTVLVTWSRFGPIGYNFGPFGYTLITVPLLYLTTIIVAAFQAPIWIIHVRLLILPISIWLYYMIGQGKDWARITLLIFISLETLPLMIGVVIHLSEHALGHSPSSLSDFLFGPRLLVPQAVLQIVAVSLLFGQVPRIWFRAMKIYNQQPKTEAECCKTL